MKSFLNTKRPPLDIYRTADAVFVHRLPALYRLRQNLLRTLSPVSLPLFAVMLTMLVFRPVPVVVPDDIIFCFVFAVIMPLVPLLLGFLQKEQYLLRIDSEKITKTTWFFGKGSTKSIKRPENLNLFYKPQIGWYFEPAKFTLSFGAADWEITSLRKVLDEFEKEVPPSKHAAGVNIPLPEPGRSVLETMQYNGKPLLKLPGTVAETPSNGTGEITVLCPRCNAAVPQTNIRSGDAADSDVVTACSACGTAFEVNGLKFHTPPKRCRAAFTEDETGLHLHYKPRFVNIMTACYAYFVFVSVFSFGLIFAGISECSWQKVIEITAGNAELRQAAMMFIGLHFVCIAAVLWTTFTQRFIDFDKETVRFRLRWLFLQRQWSVPRTETGVFCLTTFSLFWGIIFLPYRKKFFAVPASTAEKHYINRTVNRYLWKNPPAVPRTCVDGSDDKDNELPETCIGGVDETGGIDKPNHVRFVRQTENGSHYFIEPVPPLSETEQCTLPELPGLTVSQTEETLRIDYRSTLPTLSDRIGIVCFLLCLLALCISLFLWTLRIDWQAGLLQNGLRIAAMSMLMLPLPICAMHVACKVLKLTNIRQYRQFRKVFSRHFTAKNRLCR
ncbi:MAG: hypothetical protein LBH00_12980 [Planctomycetaceae bacterium]|nr:hypothetical protein [Planctomycetaceae bacterium]